VAEKILSLSRAVSIAMYPRVSREQRLGWEAYAMDNYGWLNTSLDIQRSNPAFKGTISDEWIIVPRIFDQLGIATERPFYYPSWHGAPISTASFNWDINSFYPLELAEIERERTVIMGRTVNLPTNEQEIQETIAIANAMKKLVGEDNHPEEPIFPTYYPIVAKVSKEQIL
jgi:hypothetical protein